jgi:hypothetical protein
MREPFRALPRSAQVEITATILLYVAAVAALFPTARPHVTAGLIVIFALAGLVKPVFNPSGGTNVPNMGLIIVSALLWRPSEVLIGVGVGSGIGMLLFQRNPLWLAGTNAQMWGLPAGVATAVAQIGISNRPPGLLSLAASAVLAVAAYRVANMGLFALYRSQRFGLNLVRDWFHNLTLNVPSQFLSAPLAVVVAAIVQRFGSVELGLALNALSALGMPVARLEIVYYQRSLQMLDEIVESVVRALEGVDPGARGHGERVAAIAVETGRRFGLSERHLAALNLAGRLHDVGLLAGPEATANPENVALIGSRILRRFPDPLIAEIVRRGRERWDGKDVAAPGTTTPIPLAARILAAAEVYDSAVQGLPPFETPRSPRDAAGYLIGLAGSVLDPKVVMVMVGAILDRDQELPAAG